MASQTQLFPITDHSSVAKNSMSFHLPGNLTMSHPHHTTQSQMIRLSLQLKAIKQLFKKAEQDGKDPWLALLDYRNTPTEGINASPAQRLMLRRTRTLLPTASSLLRPEVCTQSTEKLEWKRQKAKFYHDRHAKQLPELEIGQEVRMQPLRKNQTWKEATCIEKLSDRSYVVKSGNEFFRRKRQFLRPAAEPSPTEKHSTKTGSQEPQAAHEDNSKVPKSPSKPASPKQGSSEGTVATETQVPVSASQKTRTRSIRLPSRFKDFDMKH